MVDDFTAAGASEISVRKGQQVEVLDLSPGQPNWCYIRTLASETGEQFQGLVPTATLKPIPRLLGPGSRTSLEFEGQCKYWDFLSHLLVAMCYIGVQNFISPSIHPSISQQFIGSPEPKAHGELIVYQSLPRPSVCQHFQTSSPLKPLRQLNSNFIWRLLRMREQKVCSNGPGHMTKMANTLYMVKNL